MKLKCKHCGGEYKVPNETVELLNDGWISPDQIEAICPDCEKYTDEPEDQFYSDADPGL